MTSGGISPAIAAVVERGDCIDAWHSASVAVVDATGRLIASFGAPSLVTATRSSIKPFQALALVQSGAARALGLTDEDLAIACSSHSGLDEHVQAVRALLSKAEATASDLRCGAHLPIGYRLSGKLPFDGEHEDPLRHNCSGKHAGFLALSRHLGEDKGTYLSRQSRTQQLALDAVMQACALASEPASGTDGCGAPNYALRLESLAFGMVNLATSAGDSPLSAIRAAMQRNPSLVSGEGRFDLDLMRAYPQNVICKSGAEAIQAFGFREPALGVALKVHDGGERALAPISCAVLDQLGLLGLSPPGTLARHRRPAVRNAAGTVTGAIVPSVTLERHAI